LHCYRVDTRARPTTWNRSLVGILLSRPEKDSSAIAGIWNLPVLGTPE
jgi:hypothetical protein